jgi:hypothetical protein
MLPLNAVFIPDVLLDDLLIIITRLFVKTIDVFWRGVGGVVENRV